MRPRGKEALDMANEGIRVGKPDTTHDAPAHTPGIKQGNEPGGTDADPGLEETGEVGAGRPSMVSTARKSTGINPELRNPIDPNSPNLPPN
jgi:hypothetical protein